MFNRRNLPIANRRYLSVLTALTLIVIICAAFGMGGNNDFDIAKREVLLRKVGHEILLQSGDSRSRVLPIEKISENEYRIWFENEFTFQTDSLVNITRRLLENNPIAGDYIVNVLNCSDSSIAYGYSISKNTKDDIIACTEREQPRGCYMINITFKPSAIITTTNKYLLGSLPVVAIVGFIFSRAVKPRKATPNSKDTKTFTFGTAIFNAGERQLIINEKTTDLTATETRLLLIFALSPNQVIERSRLQKEIWEDEGVIVGRSLDIFISKLRKKLEPDPNINIVVVRGKGYKLEVGS